MSINVIDNFEIGVSKPIDNRFVVGPSLYYTNRDLISYKYVGLRIWDLNAGAPYVWTGATWSSETAAGTVNGTGTSGTIAKFVGPNSIENSIITEASTAFLSFIPAIGIGTPANSNDKLRVGGNVRLTSGVFHGNGSGITNINGNNIQNGSIPIIKLTNGTVGQLLSAGLSSPVWVNPSSVTVGNVNIITDDVNNTLYIPFVSDVGNQQIKINTTNSIRINPSNGNIGIGASATSQKLEVVGGNIRVRAASSSLNIGSSSSCAIQIGAINTGLYRSNISDPGPPGIAYPYLALTLDEKDFLELRGEGTNQPDEVYIRERLRVQKTSRFVGAGQFDDGFRTKDVRSLSGQDLHITPEGTKSIKLNTNVQLLNQTGIEFLTPQFPLSESSAVWITHSGKSSTEYLHSANPLKDRYITVFFGTAGSGSARLLCKVETGDSTNMYVDVERRDITPYAAASFLVPAKCRFQVIITPLDTPFSSETGIHSRGFGV